MTAGTVGNARERRGWTVLDASGLDRPAQARLVAVPTPRDGVRLAWETSLLEGDDGCRLVRRRRDRRGARPRELVDYLADNPTWTVFPNSPPQNYASTDTRVRWCWLATTNCALVLNNPASPPWDLRRAHAAVPTFTTRGNNAVAVHNWDSNDSRTRSAPSRRRPRPDREYTYPWTNQWFRAALQPDGRSRRRSATTSTRRGRTCSRCTTGCTTGRTGSASPRRRGTCSRSTSAAAGRRTTTSTATPRPAACSGGPPGFQARDNANQFTPADGQLPITNMYLWQPIAAAFYAPVRGRRLRHVGDRPRVRPRDLQPHGGRPEHGPVRQPAAGHGRELVGPDGDPSTCTRAASRRSAARTRSPSART